MSDDAKAQAYARLLDEDEQLAARIEKLRAFDRDKVARTQAQLLGVQLEVMEAYRAILQARIAAWNIDD